MKTHLISLLFIILSFSTNTFSNEVDQSNEEKNLFNKETRDSVHGFSELERVETKTPDCSKNCQSVASFELGGVYDSLIDESNSLNLVSELQPFFKVSWSQLWSDFFTTSIGIDHIQRKYTDLKNNNYTFSDKEESQSSVFIGLGLHFSKNLNFHFRVNYGDQIYYKEVSEGKIGLQKDRATGLEIAIDKRIITVKKLSASVIGEYEYTSKGKRDFSSANLAGAGLQIQHDFHKKTDT